MANQITYRLATDADINAINAFYNRVYQRKRTYEEFYWEYNSAPAGKAIYVIAEEGNEIVGTQCAIPYYVIDRDNKETLSAKSEDTLVSPNHRGRQIFEHMYQLLFEECRKNGIVFIWGFTYADKPFRKLGFEIPYKSSMGLQTINPRKAATYFYALTAKKGFAAYAKILAMCVFSRLEYGLSLLKKNKLEGTFSFEKPAGITSGSLQHAGLFGLKLDGPFLDYRIYNNAYSKNYQVFNYYHANTLQASLFYNITKDHVGYIIHLYFNASLPEEQRAAFVRQAIQQTALKQCIVVRSWEFTHNRQNAEQVAVMKKAHFVILNRGISFVGLKLNHEKSPDFSNFVLSRMASQGTD